jgi:uncharacterized protein YbjQ (UPF0145 family)
MYSINSVERNIVSGLKSSVYVLSQQAEEIGYDAVHNIRFIDNTTGTWALGDGIRLKNN